MLMNTSLRPLLTKKKPTKQFSYFSTTFSILNFTRFRCFELSVTFP